MRFGEYEVTGEVGRGGMGVVLRGRAPDGADVAIKLLQRARAHDLARFERERRLLGQIGALDGFVPLLEQGDAPEGPFLVMPFLPGGTLRDRLQRGPLGVDAAVELGRTLARALAQAHARGVVHRDLKPENVLFDAAGAPRIADLGLAKHFRRDVPGASRSVSVTGAGEFRGTAGYMPPEQMLDVKTVGPAADVFALGVLLYECLAGQPAFAGDTLHEVVGAVANERPPSLHDLRADVPRWLVRVIDRALEKRPEDRPADAAAFLAALDAGVSSRARGAPALAGLALALACAGAVALVVMLGRATSGEGDRGRGVAELTSQVAEPAPSDPLLEVAITSDPPAAPLDPRADADLAPLVERPRARLTAVLGQLAFRHPDAVLAVAVSPDGALAWAGGQDARLRAWDLLTGRELTHLPARREVRALAAIGDQVVSGEADGVVRVWHVPTRRQVWDYETTLGAPAAIVAHPDGRRVVVGCEGGVVVLDVDARRVVLSLPVNERVLGAAVSADGQRLACAVGSSGVAVFDLTLGEPLPPPTVDDARAVAFTATGALVTGDSDGRVRVTPGDVDVRALEGAVTRLVVGPDDQVVVGGDGGQIVRLRLRPGATPRRLGAHGAPVTGVIVTPDGARAVTSSFDDTVGVWEVETGGRVPLGPGHSAWVLDLVALDEQRALSTGGDGRAWIWELATGAARALDDVPHATAGGALGGDRFAVAAPDGVITCRALGSPSEVIATLRGDPARGSPRALATSSDRRHVFALASDGTLAAWSVDGGAELHVVDAGDDAHALAAGDDVVFTGDGAGLHAVRSFTGPSLVARDAWPQGAPVRALDVAAGRVFVGLADGRVRVLDAATGAELTGVRPHASSTLAVAASPGGGFVLSGGRDGSVALHDARTGEELDRVQLPADLATAVAWLPGGRGFLVGTGRGAALRFALDDDLRLDEVIDAQPAGEPSPERAIVRGVVRGPGGEPAVGVTVLLWRHDDRFTTVTVTGQDGSYAAAVPYGRYNVAFNKPDLVGHRSELPSGAVDNVSVPEERVADCELAEGEYAARVLSVVHPERVRPGQRFEATLEVVNTGTAVWKQARVGLSNERFGEPGRGGTSAFQDPDWVGVDRPAPLPEVRPGARARVRVPLTAPEAVGRHVLHLELVEEMVAWFDGHGDDVTIEIEVASD